MPLTQEAPVPAGVLLQASGGCQVPPLPGKTQALLSLHASRRQTLPSLWCWHFLDKPASIYWAFTVSLGPSAHFTCVSSSDPPSNVGERERDTIIHFTDAKGEVGGFTGFAPNPTIRSISVESGLEFRAFQL